MDETKVEESKYLTKVSNITKVQKMIYCFFIYSFIGWLLETVYCFILFGQIHNRGFLFGPFCMMYGFAAVALVLLFEKTKINHFTKFLICFICFTIFEYLVSLVLEMIFGLRWWDYSNDAVIGYVRSVLEMVFGSYSIQYFDIILNFQGRISIVYSVVWGTIGVLLLDVLNPFISKVLDKGSLFFSRKTETIIVNFLVASWIVDVILSILRYLHLN